MYDGSRDFIHWLTDNCGNVENWVQQGPLRDWLGVEGSQSWDDAVCGVCSTQGMLNLVYAVLGVCWTRCMLYSVYAVLSVRGTWCMLYLVYTVLTSAKSEIGFRKWTWHTDPSLHFPQIIWATGMQSSTMLQSVQWCDSVIATSQNVFSHWSQFITLVSFTLVL